VPPQPPKRNRLLASALVFLVVAAGIAASELTRSDNPPDRVQSRLDKPPEFGKQVTDRPVSTLSGPDGPPG
jgi:hypothetical protein